MKKNFLRRNKIRWIIPVMAMLTMSPTMYGAPPNNASGSSDKTAKHAELTAKYGLTQQQLQQFDQLTDERNAAHKAINNNSALSRQESSKQIKEIWKDFEKKMASVMNKEQYDKWTKDRSALKQQNAGNSKELTAKISKINKSDIPLLQQKEQIAKAEAEFTQKAASINENQEKAEQKLDVRHSRNTVVKHDKKNVKLSLEQAKQLEILKADRDRKIDELAAERLPPIKLGAESYKIMASYYAKVKDLLGDQKYAQWRKNIDAYADQRLKSRYKMTPAQIEKYKEVQNARAVEHYVASRSKLPKPEREAMYKEIDARYDAMINTILTANQSRKMLADKAYHRQQQAAQTTQTTQNK